MAQLSNRAHIAWSAKLVIPKQQAQALSPAQREALREAFKNIGAEMAKAAEHFRTEFAKTAVDMAAAFERLQASAPLKKTRWWEVWKR